jgi:hypothetical protein
MSARVIPYRSLRQVEADATQTAVATTLVFVAVRAFAHADNLIVDLVLCMGVYLALGLISEAVHIWRARRRNAEIMPYDAMLRRFFTEQADRTLLDTAARTALVTTYGLTVMMLPRVRSSPDDGLLASRLVLSLFQCVSMRAGNPTHAA